MLISALNSIGPFHVTFHILCFKGSSLGCFVIGSSLIWKKKRSLAKMTTRCTTPCHLLCLFLSLVVPLFTICSHAWSFIVTCCNTRYHLMYHCLSAHYLTIYTYIYIYIYIRRKNKSINLSISLSIYIIYIYIYIYEYILYILYMCIYIHIYVCK